MAKGDHSRAQNKVDEQQKLAQGYLTQTQQNIGNNAGRNNDLYWGAGAPNYGNVYGWGTTVPNYNPYGSSPFTGNGTDTPMFSAGGGTSANGGQNYQQMFNSLFPGNTLSSNDLSSHEQQLQQMGFRLLGPNAAGMRSKIELPNGQVVDLIRGAGAGGGTGEKQWLISGGGGGGLGAYGPGGMPGMAIGDYQQLQGLYGSMIPQYQGLFNDIGSRYQGLYGDIKGSYAPFLGDARSMAETGGLSDTDKAALRSRAISPIRSVYSQGLQNLSRQRSLQGGYSPGYTTALGRFNRDMGQQTSDATTNAEAAIAELVQKGKLGGLGAWASGLGGQTSGLLGALSGMTSGQLGALGGQMGAIGGMAGLYGQTPGLASFFANENDRAIQNQLTAAGLQNQLGLGIMGQQTATSNIPGNYQNALSNIGGTLGLFPSIGGMVSGIGDWMSQRGNGNFHPYSGGYFPQYGDPNMVPGDYDPRNI